MYRSVRGSVAVPRNRYVYFEMTLYSAHNAEIRRHMQRTNDANVPFDRRNLQMVHESSDVSVCIGLSTRRMPLNTLVGTSNHSVH